MNTRLSNSEPHPLFAKNSLYGEITEGSLWHDDGVSKIRGFFETIRKEELHEEWRDGNFPAVPQDWGMGDEGNADYHNYLLEKHKPSMQGSVDQRKILSPTALRGAPGGEPAPITVIFDLRFGDCHFSKDESVDRFSGAGEWIPGRRIRSFDVDIPLTRLHEHRPLESSTVCRFLILRDHVIGVLAELMEAEPHRFGPDGDLRRGVDDLTGLGIRSHEQSIAVLRQLVTNRSLLAPAVDNGAEYRRAFWLSAVLGVAPGLQGPPQVDGRKRRFAKHVDLRLESPVVAGFSLGVLFVGP